MRKFFIIILVFTLLLTGISGCKNEENLFDFVSELRCEIYQGSSENFSVKAVYGFKEQPFNNDGKVGEVVYGLTFKILDKETEMSSYSLNFSVGEQTYRADFILNPINDTLSAFV